MSKRTVSVQVMLSVLGLDRRLELIEKLSVKPMSNAALSKVVAAPIGIWDHLSQLTSVGLLDKTRYSRRDVVYNVNVDALNEVIGYLTSLRDEAKESNDAAQAIRSAEA